MGECKRRVGATMCRFHGVDMVCSQGWGVLVARCLFPPPNDLPYCGHQLCVGLLISGLRVFG